MNLINDAFYVAWDNQHNEIAMVQWSQEEGGWRIMYHDWCTHPEVFTPIYMALDPSDFEDVKDSGKARDRMWRLVERSN